MPLTIAPRCAWIISCLALASACYAQRNEADESARHLGQTSDAGACGCGDGVVAAAEECDPEAPGWQGRCDASCKRTLYQACASPEDCSGLNSNCAAYTNDPGRPFCATYCERDADCPALPGFRAVCNFAWCAVPCDHGACPNHMLCLPDQRVLDHAGTARGEMSVCVIESE